jgi:RNA polymerase sigma-70 factor, ECF subfamily
VCCRTALGTEWSEYSYYSPSPLVVSEPTFSEDAELIRAAQRGNLEAFAELLARHHASVRACLSVRMSNLHDAEDLAQEALIVAFRKLAQCNPDLPLGPWLRGIALNLLANHRRKFRAEPIGSNQELQALLDEEVASGYGANREAEAFHALRECLEQLDGPARELVHRRYTEGATLEELAQLFQRKTSAISMQLHRLRLLLAQCIEGRLSPSAS